MKVIVMVIVLMMDENGKMATSTVTAEFNGIYQCRAASQSIIEQTNKTKKLRVVSSGCYEKG